MTAPAQMGKTGPKPAKRIDCGMCQGSGTVLVDPSDARKGEKSCTQCNGIGQLSLVRDAHQPRRVADRLDLPYRTVLNLIHSGQLGYVPAGRYYLVPQSEIDRYLDEHLVRGITAT